MLITVDQAIEQAKAVEGIYDSTNKQRIVRIKDN